MLKQGINQQKNNKYQSKQFINILELAEKQQQQIVPNKILQDKKCMMDRKLKAQPIAELKLTRKICQLIQQLLPLKQIRKGVNEVYKQIAKNSVEVVILAADCDPLEIIMILPELCEQKNIQYCFVPSKAFLGRACGIKRPVVATAIIFKEGSPLASQITELKDKIQQLFI